MIVVGGQRVIAAGDDYDQTLRFYGDLFRRTPALVKPGSLTRHVGYESHAGGGGYLHFFGIEVDQVENIPDGMVAWVLDDETWTVWQGHGGQTSRVSREAVRWQWLDRGGPGRWPRCSTQVWLPVSLWDGRFLNRPSGSTRPPRGIMRRRS